MNITNLFLSSQNQTSLIKSAQKSADQTINNNNTLFDDADLKISMSANSTYLVDVFLVFTSAAAADLKVCMKAITGATGYWGVSYDVTPTAKSLGDVQALGTDASTQFTWFHGIIKTTTAGTFQIQWAQNTADAGNTTLKANSYISAILVGV